MYFFSQTSIFRASSLSTSSPSRSGKPSSSFLFRQALLLPPSLLLLTSLSPSHSRKTLFLPPYVAAIIARRRFHGFYYGWYLSLSLSLSLCVYVGDVECQWWGAMDVMVVFLRFGEMGTLLFGDFLDLTPHWRLLDVMELFFHWGLEVSLLQILSTHSHIVRLFRSCFLPGFAFKRIF